MKDEIREILDKLKDSATFPIIDVPTMDGTDSEPMDNTVLLETNECKQLYDYITNLQGYYNDNVNKYEELLVKYSNLQKENEKLKEELQQEKKDFKEANDYCFELKNYKSRCEKAKEIYKNRNTCKYKKERFMEDKSTSDLMYETLTGGDE